MRARTGSALLVMSTVALIALIAMCRQPDEAAGRSGGGARPREPFTPPWLFG